MTLQTEKKRAQDSANEICPKINGLSARTTCSRKKETETSSRENKGLVCEPEEGGFPKKALERKRNCDHVRQLRARGGVEASKGNAYQTPSPTNMPRFLGVPTVTLELMIVNVR